MEPKEAVGEDSTIEECAQLTLDEAWDAPLLDARVTEPGLQMMLDHAVESGRLGPAWEVSGRCSKLSQILHPAIVVSAPGRYHQVEGIEVSAKQRVALLASGHLARGFPPFLQDWGGLVGTPGDSRGQRVGS